MIRSVALLGLLGAVVACKSSTTNPWARKTWDEASLRAWSEECAGTEVTVRDSTNGYLSFTSKEEPGGSGPDAPMCSIVLDEKRRRLAWVDILIHNTKAAIYPDEYKLNYSKQLALVVALVPPDVATVVRAVARGPAQRVVKGPFIIEGGFDRSDRWDLKIQLAAD